MQDKLIFQRENKIILFYKRSVHRLNELNPFFGVLGFIASVIIGIWGIRLTNHANLLSQQSLALTKQTNKNREQIDTLTSIIKELRKQNRALVSIVDKQNRLIESGNGQVLGLKELIKKSQNLNQLAVQQNDQTRGVLKNVADMLDVQRRNQKADMVKNFYQVYDIVKSLPQYDMYDWAGIIVIWPESTENRVLQFVKPIKERMEIGLGNPYLTYDTAASSKWLSLYFLSTDLVNTIEMKIPYIPQPKWDENRRIKMWDDFTKLKIEYPKFLKFFEETRGRLNN